MARLSTPAPPPTPTVPVDVTDARLPLHDVLGPGAGAVLEAAVAPGGGTVRRATPRQVSYEPERSVVVRWDVSVDRPGRPGAQESIVLSAGRPAPAGALVLDDGTHRIDVWASPHDPWLPGLAPALDGGALAGLLGELGAPGQLRPPRLRVYRPGRRAVVEVRSSRASVFVKVVPPARAADLHARHRALCDPAPVPRPLGWDPALGLVVLQALPGRTLRRELVEGRAVPDPATVLGLLDRLPAPDGPARQTMGETARYASLLGRVAPGLADRVAALHEGLVPFAARVAAEPRVAVHGDLHEAQLLVDGGAVTGLLDVDTFGAGARVEDLGAMVGHLVALADGPGGGPAVRPYARRLLDAFDRTVEPALLRAVVAATLLGLATGPFRVLEPGWRLASEARVALAEDWLASARRLGGS